jgi:glucoamylase
MPDPQEKIRALSDGPRGMKAAPGRPGVRPRWTSGRKSGVGTALSGESSVWFTIAHGILNEIYYPRIDCANSRDVGFLVSGEGGFFSEEKRDARHAIAPLAQGAPAYRIVNTCKQARYRLTKSILTDPRRAAVLMKVKFEALQGRPGDYRLFLLAAPHLANEGARNRGWVGRFSGTELLLAQRAHVALAIGCDAGWKARSCGFVGASDGWQQVRATGRLAAEYEEAADGNIALTGEIDLAACGGEFLVVLGFGGHAQEAGYVTRAVLLSDFADTQREFLDGWARFQSGCAALAAPMREAFDVYRVSLAVLRTHESKLFHGAIVASLSIPWGGHRGDRDIGGYHLVWPRDLVHAAIALLAAGREEDARQAMFHLMCVQRPAGNWTQNMWVDGEAHWTAEQSDQTAGFILLVAALRRYATKSGPVDPWSATRRAAEFLLHQGPISEQDRWEENRGYTPYTLATMIAALLAAAEFAEERAEPSLARRCREAAAQWDDRIEHWLYVTDTPLARAVGVEGYYVRLAPPETNSPDDLRRLVVSLKNHHPPERGKFTAAEVVSPDALALVRYGLRRADDPRIRNTVRVIDATLCRETRAGPAWRRFTHDGYGEDEHGLPFAGAGIGRCWPVLTGERAHYELARGDRVAAERLMHAMLAQSHAEGGLFPEQIWDTDDLPACGLRNGEPTGSALPLVWAHAEFVTLLRSMRDGVVFDCPRATRWLRA